MKNVMILFTIGSWLWGAVRIDEKMNARQAFGPEESQTIKGYNAELNIPLMPGMGSANAHSLRLAQNNGNTYLGRTLAASRCKHNADVSKTTGAAGDPNRVGLCRHGIR